MCDICVPESVGLILSVPVHEHWFDHQMQMLEPFQTTLTLCFTPEHLGLEPHYASPPKNPEDFTDFARWAVNRYAGASATSSATFRAITDRLHGRGGGS